MEKILCIWLKQFFKWIKIVFLFNWKVYLFLVFEFDVDQQLLKEEVEDFWDYICKNYCLKLEWQDICICMFYEVLEMVEFILEIDLYIEEFCSDFKKLSNVEILCI